MTIKIGALLFGVTDLTKARPFYEELFGLEVVEFRPPFMQAKLGDLEFNIEEDAPYRSPGWAQKHIGGSKSFTFEVEDIEEFFERAQGLGATIVEQPQKREWGWVDGVIADPDGNEFTIEQEL